MELSVPSASLIIVHFIDSIRNAVEIKPPYDIVIAVIMCQLLFRKHFIKWAKND